MKTGLIIFLWVHIAMMLLSGCGSQSSGNDAPAAEEARGSKATTEKPSVDLKGTYSLTEVATVRTITVEFTEDKSTMTIFTNDYRGHYTVVYVRGYDIGNALGASLYEINYVYESVTMIDHSQGDKKTDYTGLNKYPKKGEIFYQVVSLADDNLTPEFLPQALDAWEARTSDKRSEKLSDAILKKK